MHSTIPVSLEQLSDRNNQVFAWFIYTLFTFLLGVVTKSCIDWFAVEGRVSYEVL